jgi:sialate O-acetylesterase
MTARPEERRIITAPVAGRFFISLCFGLLGALGGSSVQALEMCSVFASDMVLQADGPIRIWGETDPAGSVEVVFSSQRKTAKADADGQWTLELEPMAASNEPRQLTVTSSSGSKIFENVLVGDVWVCGGQSNMFQPNVENSTGGAEALKTADLPLLRIFSTSLMWAPEPQRDDFPVDAKPAWKVCDPEVAAKTSALPFYFGREILAQTNRPLGLLIVPLGASVAESWIPMADLEKDADFAEYVASCKGWMANYPERRERYKKELADWEARKTAAEAAGEPFKERRPSDINGELFPRFWVGAMHNAYIAPLRDLSVKGVIWYQGESNANRFAGTKGDLEGYLKVMEILIDSWRRGFGNPNLPFLQVQLSMFNWNDFNNRRPRNPNVPGGWSVIREAQEKSAKSIPGSGLVVSWDIGQKDDIHPINKRPVGERLAHLALRDVYGEKDIVADGPAYESHSIENDAIRVRFAHTHGGLKTKGDTPLGFAIAGEDRKFHWAEAVIEGEEVLVRSPEVPKPVAVRFAYIQFQDTDLFNAAGWPAVPFRTDDWALEKDSTESTAAPTP